MKFLPISARFLRRRNVQFLGEKVENVTLFPFFDTTGTVCKIMILFSHINDVFFLQVRQGLCQTKFWGMIRIDSGLFEMQTLSSVNLIEFEKLWHFDPWWLLKAPRYKNKENLCCLKKTNCVPQLSSRIYGMFYTNDLTKIKSVVVNKDGEMAFVSFDKNLLISEGKREQKIAKQAIVQETSSLTWKLEPIWEIKR